MKNIVLMLVCAFLSLNGAVHADSQDALHKRFMTAIGLYEQIEQQLVALDALGADTAQQYANQIVDAFPAGLPDELSEDMKNEMEKYMNKINEAIDPEIMADTYINLIAKKLSDAELSELIGFYESDLGRKFTKANTAVMGEWATVVQGDMQDKMQIYTQEFVESLMRKASSY